MSEKRKYRTFSPDQKTEIVLAGLRGDRSVRDVCREYEISETLHYQWRDRLLEGGKAALATRRDKDKDPRDGELRDAKKRIAQLERALGRRPTSWRSRGNSRGTGRERPCVQSPRGGRHRTSPGRRGPGGRHQPPGDLPTSHPPPATAGPRAGRPGDAEIVEVARANPADGTSIVAALASRELGEPVNRKRAQAGHAH